MKKKSPRSIPDFSHSRQPGRVAPGAASPQGAKASQPAAPRPTVKPQATSQKSGRRGQ